MNFLTLYTIPPLLSSILFIFLGIAVYLNNRKSNVNILFALVCFVTFWWQFSWFILFNTQSEVLANYLVKIGHIGIIFIPVFFFHFFLSFLRQILKISKIDKYLLYFSYLMGVLFEIALLTTNYFIDGFYKYSWGFYPKASFLHTLYLLLLSILVLRVTYLLFATLERKKEISPTEYRQTKYILWSLVFYIFASSDFFVNYGIEFYPVGFLFIVIFLGITAYAITMHHLFGIRVILTEALVIATGLTLLIQAIIAETLLLKVLGGALFGVFAIFGYQLVRSIIQEIQLRAELQVAYKELEKLDKAKTEFLSIASHQLRTPLTAIKGYISMILEKSYGKIPGKIIRPLKNVFTSNERLVKLVNDLLDVSRIETGKMELELEKTSLEDMISSVVYELEIQAKKKNLNLKWEKPKIPLPEILIDKAKIRQVILNLIDNAIKYTEKGGITVKAEKINSKINIAVKDSGAGMGKDEPEKIFGILTRGKAGLRLWTEGAGLGLHIARSFVNMHNGKIWAESEGHGKGSTFFVELPIK